LHNSIQNVKTESILYKKYIKIEDIIKFLYTTSVMIYATPFNTIMVRQNIKEIYNRSIELNTAMASREHTCCPTEHP